MGSSDLLPVAPDYSITEQYSEGVVRSKSAGGTSFQRIIMPSQRQFHLVFNNRPISDKNLLINLYRETEATYFEILIPVYNVSTGVYVDRYFPVIWSAAPQFEWVSNDCWNMAIDVIEAVGCSMATGHYPDPTAGHPTATITGTAIASDKVFMYCGYGFTYTGAGTLALDGSVVTSPKYDISLGLHRLYVTGGSGTLEAVI